VYCRLPILAPLELLITRVKGGNYHYVKYAKASHQPKYCNVNRARCCLGKQPKLALEWVEETLYFKLTDSQRHTNFTCTAMQGSHLNKQTVFPLHCCTDYIIITIPQYTLSQANDCDPYTTHYVILFGGKYGI